MKRIFKVTIKRVAIAFLTLLLLATLPLTGSRAGGTQLPGYVGGVSVRAEKGVYPSPGSWLVTVGSYAANTIGTIGYTWWTAREECKQPNGSYTIIYQWNSPSGAVNYNSTQYYSAGTHYYHSCSSARRLSSLGNHDFKQFADIWRPYLSWSELK